MSPELKQLTKDTGGLTKALAGMKPGEKREGFLGGEGSRKPDYIPEEEVLSPAEAERKRIIFELLMKWVVPNELSAKSTPRIDKRSLASKLNKTTLARLLGFLPPWFKDVPTKKLTAYLDGEEELSDADHAYIQDQYKDISP